MDEFIMDPVKETIKSYEKTAKKYAKNNSVVEDIKPLLDFFVYRLKGNKVLDVGIGPGLTTQFFTDHGLKVIGIDLTNNFLKMAEKKAPKARIMQMDMRRLKFADGRFDGIFVCASFLHVPKSEALQTLKGFNRVMKKGGLIFIAVKKGDKEGFAKNVGKYFTLYQTDELKGLMESAGFKIIKATEEKKNKTTWIDIFALKV